MGVAGWYTGDGGGGEFKGGTPGGGVSRGMGGGGVGWGGVGVGDGWGWGGGGGGPWGGGWGGGVGVYTRGVGAGEKVSPEGLEGVGVVRKGARGGGEGGRGGGEKKVPLYLRGALIVSGDTGGALGGGFCVVWGCG